MTATALAATDMQPRRPWNFLRRRLGALGLSGRALVIAAPALWLTIFFLIPLLIVLQVSLSASAIAIPPYLPLITTDAKSKYGYFGTAWNWDGSYKEATKIGYPAGVNEGETMEVVNGPITIEDGIVKMTHHGVPNQHGSSGGAWLAPWSTNVDEEEKNYVISLESHGRGEDGVTYGPYFDDRFANLLDYVEKGCQ